MAYFYPMMVFINVLAIFWVRILVMLWEVSSFSF